MADSRSQGSQGTDTPASRSRSGRPRGPLRLGSRHRAPPPNRRAWVVAGLLHVLVGLLFLNIITFGRGFSDLLDFGANEPAEEIISYVERAEPEAPEPPPAQPQETRQQAVAEPISTGPVRTDAQPLPATPPTASRDTGAALGPPTVGALNPNLRGVQPDYADARVWGTARQGMPTQRNGTDNLDSIISFAITTAADSLDAIARANGEGGRTPGDWTVRGKDGDKWGWDGVGIRLGKVTIPNALLALLPMNAQAALSSNPTSVDRERRLALARADIMRNSQRSVGEAEFKNLVKELRERKEREYQNRRKAADARVADRKNDPPPPPTDR